MDKKRTFLILILISLGVLFQIFFNNGFSLFDKSPEDLIEVQSNYYDYIFDNKIIKSDIIEIINLTGNILVEGTDNEKSIISTKIKIFHKDKKEADKIIKKINLTVDKQTNTTVFASKFKDSKMFRKVEINYTVKLSKGTKIIILNSNGNIEVSNIRNKITLSNSNGNILLSKIKGDIFIKHSKNNTVKINKVCNISANLINSSTEISNSIGNIKISGENGLIKLKNILTNEKEIKIVFRKGDISLTNIKNKKSDIKISFGDLFIKQVLSKDFDLKIINGNTVINSNEYKTKRTLRIFAKDSSIIIKSDNVLYPRYIFNLEYGKISGNINDFKIIRDGQFERLNSTQGNPNIFISGKYTDVKIIKIIL